VTGDFSKLAEIGNDLITDTKDWGVNYYNIVKNTLNTTAGLFDSYADKINSAATFNFQTGKIEPFMPGKKSVVPGGDEDDTGAPKELNYYEQLAKNLKTLQDELNTNLSIEQATNIELDRRIQLIKQIAELESKSTENIFGINATSRGFETGKTLQEKVKEEGPGQLVPVVENPMKPAEESTDNMAQQFGSIINAATTIGSILNVAADSFAGKLIQGFSVVTQIANSILGIVSAFTGGLGGGIFSLFGKHGGAFENGKQVAKFAGGGDFMVPSGFSNDSFPMMVQSGERVTVTPTGRVGDEAKYLAELVGVGKATNKSIAVLTSRIDRLETNINIDGKKLVKEVTKPIENKLKKVGINLDAL
jgi:hypothetical protein